MKSATISLVFCTLLAQAALAGTLAVEVKDGKGAGLEDTAVWAVPKFTVPPRARREAAVEQLNRRFVPLVTVVQVGALVQFPNRDEVRHHVYSFSPAKSFELKLYAGTPAAPVLFDKAGEVVLGCNIHDQMIAYVYVVDTPWFGKTGKDGRLRLEGLPAGEYELHARHPAQAAAAESQLLRMKADEAATATVSITTRPQLAPTPTK
ncbi:MAG: methylamine utilization protein [Usitatibacter sp.]